MNLNTFLRIPGSMLVWTFLAMACILLPFLDLRTSFALEGSESERSQVGITRIEEELAREKRLFEKFDEREKGILGQLSDLEEEISEKQTFLRDLRKRIDQTKQGLIGQQERLGKLEQVFREAQGRLGERLVSFYKYAKRGYVRILLSSTGLHDLMRRIKYLKAIIGEDQEMLRGMVEIRQSRQMEIERTREKLGTIDQLQDIEDERLASLREDQDKKVLLLMKVHKEKEFYETAVKELELAAQNLGNTLLEIENRPEGTKERQQLPSGFEKAKGNLPMPFPGKIARGHKILGVNGLNTHKGVTIEGSPGEAVRSVFAGRVDFSGWLKGYGQTIVINHGSRYYTISAHLSERGKDEGDTVQMGEVIGRSGAGESLAGSSLYFEIRNGGANLNPLSWLKVH